jgi:hypothetical protein
MCLVFEEEKKEGEKHYLSLKEGIDYAYTSLELSLYTCK